MTKLTEDILTALYQKGGSVYSEQSKIQAEAVAEVCKGYIERALRDASRETFTNSQGKIMAKVQDIFVDAWKSENGV